MKKLQIVKHPDIALRKKCRPINKITQLRRDKIGQMFKLMYELNGIGLAAPQVGWNAQVFVMNVSLNQDPKNELVFINPIITAVGDELIEFEEGCLSFPGITGAVDRPIKATVQAKDLNGDLFVLSDAFLAARCMQHEIDHLSGVLFIDKAKKLYKGEDKL